MRKAIIFCLFLSVIAEATFAQVNSKQMLKELSKLSDQFGKPFINTSAKEDLVLACISIPEDPFVRIFDKHIGKKLKKPSAVQFLVGFKEMAASGGVHAGGSDMSNHISEAFINKYGNNIYSVLIDLNSKIPSLAATNGFAVITIPKGNKPVTVTSFGTDRKKFLDTVEKYFK